MKKIVTETNVIDEILSRGIVEIIEKDNLRKRMIEGERLRIKFGIDPTGPDIHIGRGSTIKKLREFQELGHKIVLIIGDATAMIGDASDKTEGRKSLSKNEIIENQKDYLNQIGRILDLEKTEIRHNSEWIDSLTSEKWITLASLFTFQQMSARDNFAKRINNGDPVGYHEGLYCLLQGLDSVKVQADVEIGGTDQLFNLMAGRKIQSFFGQKSQDIITLQLLAGTDGRKMSTSWGNVILVNDDPSEKFGKIMRISDYLIPVYMECATMIAMERVKEVNRALENGIGNPMDYKKELAYKIVEFYDGEGAAKEAQNHFERVVQDKKIPNEMPKLIIAEGKISIMDMISSLVKMNLVKSKSEGRRLLSSGAIYIDEVRAENDLKCIVSIDSKGSVIRVGKRKFIRLIVAA